MSVPKWLIELIEQKTNACLEQMQQAHAFYTDQEVIHEQIHTFRLQIVRELAQKSCTSEQLEQLMEQVNEQFIQETDPDAKSFHEWQIKLIQETMQEKKAQYHSPDLRYDINMARSSIFGTKTPKTGTTAYQELTNQAGEIDFQRDAYTRVSVRNSNGVMLTTYDAMVYGAVQEMWHRKGGQQEFSFSYRELLELIGKSNSGEYPVMLQSLDNMWNTEIVLYDYFDPELQQNYTTERHRVLQSMRNNPNDYSIYVKLSDYTYKSLLGGYSIPISKNLLNDLNSSVSKLLYLFLKTYIHTNVRSFDLSVLADQLNLYNSKTKNTMMLDQAFQELKHVGFIENYTLTKSGRFYKMVLFEFGNKKEEQLLI